MGPLLLSRMCAVSCFRLFQLHSEFHLNVQLVGKLESLEIGVSEMWERKNGREWTSMDPEEPFCLSKSWPLATPGLLFPLLPTQYLKFCKYVIHISCLAIGQWLKLASRPSRTTSRVVLGVASMITQGSLLSLSFLIYLISSLFNILTLFRLF